MTSTTAIDNPAPTPGDGGRGVLLRAMVETLPSCGCGQVLDIDHARYCPRCGVVVKRGAVVTAGGLQAVA